MVELKKHQIIPINFMKTHRGLILFHSTGSGKTLTSLYSLYQFDKDIIIIGPKSSKKAFIDNMVKANFNQGRFTFYTYKKIKNSLESNLDIFKNKSVIVDEAHNLRTETTSNIFLIGALKQAYKIMLLTATPVVNYLNDLSVLVNIVKNEEVLPTERSIFNHMYYDEDDFVITSEDILYDKLKDCISYYKIPLDDNYPKSETKVIEVEMNEDQIKEYVYYVKKILLKHIYNVNPYNIDLNTIDKKKKNFFLSATRQLSNTVNGQSSPKIEAIISKIKKGPYPIIIYSNFLKNGIYPIAVFLEKNKIPYKMITGGTSYDKIDLIVNNYNSGKYKVLLLSSAGSESLDLKNTRQIHIMEPYWNEGKIIQVIGRAIRYKSHNDLPLKDRNVIIYRWVSVFPKDIVNKSADQYLVELSNKKYKIFNEFIGIIKDVSIEENIKGGYFEKYIKYKTKYLNKKK